MVEDVSETLGSFPEKVGVDENKEHTLLLRLDDRLWRLSK
jgi:hypothetical protein